MVLADEIMSSDAPQQRLGVTQPRDGVLTGLFVVVLGHRPYLSCNRFDTAGGTIELTSRPNCAMSRMNFDATKE